MHISTGVKWQFQCLSQFCLNVSALHDHSLASEHSYQHKQLVDSLIELVSCDHNSMNFVYTVLSFFLSRVNSNAKWKVNNIQFFSVENGSKLTTWCIELLFFHTVSEVLLLVSSILCSSAYNLMESVNSLNHCFEICHSLYSHTQCFQNRMATAVYSTNLLLTGVCVYIAANYSNCIVLVSKALL